MPPRIEIWLRRSDVPLSVSDVAELRLGGTCLYSDDQSRLEAFANNAVSVLLDEAQAHLTLTPSLLRHRVKEAGLQLDRRVFSALLGSALRLGKADTLLCLSASGGLFRVVVHAENLSRLSDYLAILADWLRLESRLQIPQVRTRLFPRKEWGSWTHSSAMLSRLAYLGISRQIDESTFAISPELEHALRDPGWVIATANLAGMAASCQTDSVR